MKLNLTRRSFLAVAAVLIWLGGSTQHIGVARGLDPIVYSIKFHAPDTHFAEVEVSAPTGKRPSIEMMMAVWSPGFYRVENYPTRVQDFAARTTEGAALQFEQPEKNRWRIQTGGRPTVMVSYRLHC